MARVCIGTQCLWFMGGLLGTVSVTSCVVDGVDPARTPVLEQGAGCAEGQSVVRTASGWTCDSTDGVDPARTPVLANDSACAAGQAVVRTADGWSCGDLPSGIEPSLTPVLNEPCVPGQVAVRAADGWRCQTVGATLAIGVEAATGCGSAGGQRVTVTVQDDLPAVFELCNGAGGPPGPPGPVPDSFYAWRARAGIEFRGGDVPMPTNPIDAGAPTFAGDPRLRLGPIDGPDAAGLAIPCATGNPGTPSCGGREEQVGLSFVAPTAGTYRVCAVINHELEVASRNPGGGVVFLLTTNPPDQASIEERGLAEHVHGIQAGSAVSTQTIRLCEPFRFEASERGTIRLSFWQFGDIEDSRLIGSAVFDVERLRPLQP